MSILNHESSAEDLMDDLASVRQQQESADRQLDRIYHAIPEWVNRQFPEHTLAERIEAGFAEVQKQWEKTYCQEVQSHEKMTGFVTYLVRKHGLNFMDEYWNYLISKDLEKATPSEKEVLTKMQR